MGNRLSVNTEIQDMGQRQCKCIEHRLFSCYTIHDMDHT
jgi:hypothetical protein